LAKIVLPDSVIEGRAIRVSHINVKYLKIENYPKAQLGL
jgi:hypothetical protein